jgi:hypothetical protein
MRGRQYFREGKGSKSEMASPWTRTVIKKMESRSVDIVEKLREARLRWHGQIIRKDKGEPVRDIMQ